MTACFLQKMDAQVFTHINRAPFFEKRWHRIILEFFVLRDIAEYGCRESAVHFFVVGRSILRLRENAAVTAQGTVFNDTMAQMLDII